MAVDLARWQARHLWAQAVTSLERLRHTNLDEIIRLIKNVFSELEGNNWAKIACGNVSSQALSACMAESQFKGCAAQQTLRFWAMVCSAAISSKSTGSATDAAATDPLVA